MAKDNVPKSSVYDSSDEGQSEVENRFIANKNYINELYRNAKDTLYPFSYILTDISNRLLFSKDVTEKYNKIKDPLQFKINNLKKHECIYNDAACGAKSLNINIKNREKLIADLKKLGSSSNGIKIIVEEQEIELEKDKKARKEWVEKNKKCFNNSGNSPEEIVETVSNLYQQKSKDDLRTIEKIEILQKARDELNIILKGAFPFRINKLSPKFIENYNKNLDKNDNEKVVVEALTKLRNQLDFDKVIQKSDDLDKICKLFGIKIVYDKKMTRYLDSTKKSLLNNIESVIGRAPNDDDVNEYIRLNYNKLNQDQEFIQLKGSSSGLIRYIKEKVNHDIAINSEEIYKISKQTAKYTTDPDYLQELAKGSSKEDFLVQIRAYRKLNRDIEKNVLLAGDEGTRNVPPGGNTTVKITLCPFSKNA